MRFRILLFVIANLILPMTIAHGQEFTPNAKVTAERLNVRDRYPSLTWKSLFTRKLSQGNVIFILERNDSIELLERKFVINSYEWFKIRFDNRQSLEIQEGFIYAGPVGDRRYIEITDEDTRRRFPIGSGDGQGAYEIDEDDKVVSIAVNFFIGTAWAQDSAVDDPSISLKVFIQLLLTLFVLCVFLVGAWFIVRKIFPPPPYYPSLIVIISMLLILGYIGPEHFVQFLAHILK